MVLPGGIHRKKQLPLMSDVLFPMTRRFRKMDFVTLSRRNYWTKEHYSLKNKGILRKNPQLSPYS